MISEILSPKTKQSWIYCLVRRPGVYPKQPPHWQKKLTLLCKHLLQPVDTYSPNVLVCEAHMLWNKHGSCSECAFLPNTYRIRYLGECGKKWECQAAAWMAFQLQWPSASAGRSDSSGFSYVSLDAVSALGLKIYPEVSMPLANLEQSSYCSSAKELQGLPSAWWTQANTCLHSWWARTPTKPPCDTA